MGDDGLYHICANHLDATMPATTPGLVVEMPMDSCAFCRAGVCVQSLADDVVLHMRSGDPRATKPVDHSHAIEQLRWLIEHDFKYRHGEMAFASWRYPFDPQLPPDVSRHWWDAPERRLDIARLRSYIGAVRVLERRA